MKFSLYLENGAIWNGTLVKLIIVKGALCDRPCCVTSLVGCWLVGHVRELWLNGVKAYNCYWTPVWHAALCCQVLGYRTKIRPLRGDARSYFYGVSEAHFAILLRPLVDLERSKVKSRTRKLQKFLDYFGRNHYKPKCSTTIPRLLNSGASYLAMPRTADFLSAAITAWSSLAHSVSVHVLRCLLSECSDACLSESY